MVMAMLFSALVMLMMSRGGAVRRGSTLAAAQLLRSGRSASSARCRSARSACSSAPRVSGRTAPAWVNLAYLPMTYLSGLFFPVPEAIRAIALVSPAFHLNQLALQAAGVSAIMPATWHVAALLGITVLFAGLAARRVVKMG